MHAATMSPELVMATPAETASPGLLTRTNICRVAKVAFYVAGIAGTAFILGQYDSLLVYGLPAPFLRRVPMNASA